MPDWTALEAMLLNDTQVPLGQAVSYSPLIGSPSSVVAILEIEAGAIQGAFGTAKVKIADLTAYPVKGDIVTVPSGYPAWPAGDYSVEDVERLKIGDALLVLRKKT